MKKISSLVVATSLLLPLTVPAYAADAKATTATTSVTTAATSWTYEQAIAKALELSKTVKNAKADTERSMQVLESAADDVKFYPNGPGDPQIDKAFSRYVQADNQRVISNYTLEKEKDKTTTAVRKAYNAILAAEAKTKLDELSVKNADMQRTVAQYKYQFGMASQLQQKQFDTDYEKERKSQEADKAALVGAYQAFNQLVGLKPQDRPVLTESPEFKKLDTLDVETHITQVIGVSPDIASLSKSIDVARTNLSLYQFNVPGSEPYSAKVIDLDKQETTYSNTKDQVANGLRSMYATIRQMEEQYAALQAKLPYVEETARLAKLQFDIGTGTKADVSAAELAVAQLKQQILDLEIKHDDAVNVFKKPWAS